MDDNLEFDFDMDNYMDFDFDNSTDNELSEEEETGELIQGYVSADEFSEQLAIIQDNQQVIINNLSYQSNIITFAFIVFLGVLVMKCLLHFFN
ncbi:MAG: hypothetical protein MJ232_06890 [archaeon]|nr:hypothetical protein [archaeon]